MNDLRRYAIDVRDKVSVMHILTGLIVISLSLSALVALTTHSERRQFNPIGGALPDTIWLRLDEPDVIWTSPAAGAPIPGLRAILDTEVEGLGRLSSRVGIVRDAITHGGSLVDPARGVATFAESDALEWCNGVAWRRCTKVRIEDAPFLDLPDLK